MRRKHKGRTNEQESEVHVTRSLRDGYNDRLIAVDEGREIIRTVVECDPYMVAVATADLRRTVTTDAEYEMLRVSVGGSLPCSPDDFVSGKAHRVLHDILRLELSDQLARGTEGL